MDCHDPGDDEPGLDGQRFPYYCLRSTLVLQGGCYFEDFRGYTGVSGGRES